MEQFINQIKEFTQDGVLGFYTGYEVITIFGFAKDISLFNVFTLIVAVEGNINKYQDPKILNPKPISLKFKGNTFKFGVVRYFIDDVTLMNSLPMTISENNWNASGQNLNINSLTPIAKVFAPSDMTDEVPLNKVLKNNFFTGSYVFELFDTSKSNLKMLYDESALLQELSDNINQYIPLKIASLSDRLGNIVIQLPITIISSDLSHQTTSDNLKLKVIWHKQANEYKRDLQYSMVREFDNLYMDAQFNDINDEDNIIDTVDNNTHKYIIWDKKYQIILSATTQISFIRQINFNSGMIGHEPRVFRIVENGKVKQVRTPIQSHSEMMIGESNLAENYQRKRIFDKEKSDLLKNKTFVQYKKGDYQLALSDIHHLIRLHGEKGVWLMDPYLSDEDVLNTLFYCTSSMADLRAITSLEQAPIPSKHYFYNTATISISKVYNQTFFADRYIQKRKLSKTQLLAFYGKSLNAKSGNKLGLKLEFRAKFKDFGWDFHDRFLIFPHHENGAFVWSLGTSINSLGNRHHIFQKISHGQMVADAFEDLWNQLDSQECLVWKS